MKSGFILPVLLPVFLTLPQHHRKLFCFLSSPKCVYFKGFFFFRKQYLQILFLVIFLSRTSNVYLGFLRESLSRDYKLHRGLSSLCHPAGNTLVLLFEAVEIISNSKSSLACLQFAADLVICRKWFSVIAITMSQYQSDLHQTYKNYTMIRIIMIQGLRRIISDFNSN